MSPMISIIFAAVMLLLTGGRMWYFRKGLNVAYRNIEPSFFMFMQASGYRMRGLEQAPVEQSAQLAALAWLNFLQKQSPDVETYMVRQFQDITITHYMYLRTKGQSQSGAFGWYSDLETPPAVLMHVCDKDLGSFKKALGSLFSDTEVHFERQYDTKVATGNREFDARFSVYSPDPEGARRILSAPGLMESMLRMPSVDLRVMPHRIEFVDIEHKNIASVMQMRGVKWVLPYIYYHITGLQVVHEMSAEVMHRMWVANR